MKQTCFSRDRKGKTGLEKRLAAVYIIYAQTYTHTYISVDDRALEQICQPAIPVRDAKPTGKNFCCRMGAGWQVSNLGVLGYMLGGLQEGCLCVFGGQC